MKRFAVPFFIGLICAWGGLAEPALAQQSSASDVSGPTVTSSTIAGGVFTPPPPAPAPVNAPASGPAAATITVDASPAVTVAVTAATVAVTTQLSAGTLASPTADAIPAATQVAVLSVLTGAAPTAVVITALSSGGATTQAVALGEALTGLASAPTPGQLANAVGAYNDLVNTSDPTFLADPPAEFLAINAVLSQMIAAAQLAN